MITILYRELFSIEFLHDFYSSGKCPDLQLAPTADCSRLLQSLGLRFIPSTFGGKVFGKADRTGPVNNPQFILKYPVPENTRFSFLVKPINKTFETFTQTNPDRPKGSYYCFSNLVNNVSADSLPLLVADAGSKKVSDNDLVPVKSGSFSFTHNSNEATRTGRLESTHNGEALEQTLNNNGNKFHFSFDLAMIAQGRLRFSIDGTPQTSFYNLYPAEGKDFFGIAEIFHRSALPDSHRFLQNDNSIATKSYKIAFANRSTRWRYLVTKKFKTGVTGVSVQKSGGSPIGFNPQVVLPSGQFSVSSSAAIPLKEEPVTGIVLKDQANKTIIEHLPNPAMTHLKKEGADFFSDILITI